MADEVQVPVVGGVRRRVLIVGGAAVAVVLGYLYLSRRRAAADVPAVDPATGTATGDNLYSNPAPHTTVPGSVDATNPDTITTNDEWVRAVVSDLAEEGWDATYVVTTLGRYLAGVPLEEGPDTNLVRSAWAVRGIPPVGTHPLNIAQHTTTPPPATGGSTPPPTTTPKPAPPRRYAEVQPYKPRHAPWDTLSGIAGASHRSVTELASWNNISNVNIVHPGQRIWVDPPGTYVGTKKIN